eukprot:PhM_4_TR1379/c0_g1_i1/m.40386/K00873/PK, pyk; pyruvate kinase
MARLDDSAYFLEYNVPKVVDALVESIVSARPDDLTEHTAQWAMKRLTEKQRRELVQRVDAHPSEAQLLRHLHTKQLQHNPLARAAAFSVYQEPPKGLPHMTRVVCTLGPSSSTVTAIEQLIQNGMHVARINLPHITSRDEVRTLVQNVRAAAKTCGQHVAVALDTRGYIPRTGVVVETGAEAQLNHGDRLVLTTDESVKDSGSIKSRVYVRYPNLATIAQPGTTIVIDDGNMQLVVEMVQSETDVVCSVAYPGRLSSNKVVRLVGVEETSLTALPILSTEDADDLQTLVPELGIDFIFVSGVRSVNDIKAVRDVLPENALVFSKIDNVNGLKELDAVVRHSDGVLVWRSSLGVVLPVDCMFLVQKKIISTCNVHGVPIICATHMLDSMRQNPRPTRAEASDVANAVLDSTDAVLLSSETASGAYPVDAVKVLVGIIREAEASLCPNVHTQAVRSHRPHPMQPREGICSAVCHEAHLLCAKAVVASTSASGSTVRTLSQYDPGCGIVAVCVREADCRRAACIRGVFPVWYEGEKKDRELRMQFGVECAVKMGLAKHGDIAILVHADAQTGLGKGFANIYRAVNVGE